MRYARPTATRMAASHRFATTHAWPRLRHRRSTTRWESNSVSPERSDLWCCKRSLFRPATMRDDDSPQQLVEHSHPLLALCRPLPVRVLSEMRSAHRLENTQAGFHLKAYSASRE